MTHSLKKHGSGGSSSSNMSSMGSPAAAGLGINRDSRVISKVQPKIRIIHIFAPEIINTDVENFRELVQRLTGKPSSSSSSRPGKGGRSRGKSTAGGGAAKASMRKNIMIKSDMDHAYGDDHQQQQTSMINMLSERPMMTMTMTPKRDDEDQQQHQHAHNTGSDHNNMMMISGGGGMSTNTWRVPSAGDHHHQQGSTTEFLNAFQDLDGFIQEFGGEFPYVSSSYATNPHLATFGETHQLSYRG